jgi:hypothetical protein
MADVLYEVLEKLGHVKKTGRSWMAHCPAHDDSEPSLSVSEGDSQPVILKCHATCSTESVVSALGLTMADLMAPREDVAPLVTRYPYRDATGGLLLDVVVQRGPGGKKVWREPTGVRDLPLYRLPEVLDAMEAGQSVVVVEGEKCADAVVAAGEVATTSVGGAGKWKDEYARTLADAASVTVIADADQPGIDHARTVAKSLRAAGVGEVWVLLPRHRLDEDSGYDIADQLAEGHDLNDLDDLEAVMAGPAPESGLRVLTRAEMDSIPPPQWLVAGMVTTGFTVIFGAPSSGKSFLALDWACHAATGTPWFGRQVLHRRVLYVAAEGVSGIPKRIQAWERDRHRRAEDLLLVPQVVNLRSPDEIAALELEVAQREANLIVVDTFARSMPGGDENAAQDVGMVIHSLDLLAKAQECAVIVLHHTGVDGRRERGSEALRGASDTMVKCEASPGVVKVICDKQKDDEYFSPWQLRMKPVGESVVLSLAAGLSSDDKVDRVMGALAGGMLMSYPELVKVADGDGELVTLLVEAKKLISVEQGGSVRYRLSGADEFWEATAHG